MLDLLDIARREEARCALGVSEVAAEHIVIGGGIASRGEPGTWVNSAFGLGLAVPTSDEAGGRRAEHDAREPATWRDDVQRLIEWHSEAGVEPRVELSPYADRGLVRAFADAGFVPRGFEQVFFRELQPDENFAPLRPCHPRGPETMMSTQTASQRPTLDEAASTRKAPSNEPALLAGLTIRVVDRSDERAVAEFASVVARGFARPGTEPREQDTALFARCVRHARTIAVAASLDGRMVAGGAMEELGDVVGLYGLSVLPEFRRRGIQQALIVERLAMAAARGARLATIGGSPGMGTERNVRRFGFQVAYSRIALVRPGDGLVPVS